jgi:hypothetical protein
MLFKNGHKIETQNPCKTALFRVFGHAQIFSKNFFNMVIYALNSLLIARKKIVIINVTI